MFDKQRTFWKKDQEYMAAGRKDAFGLDLSRSKLVREPVVPKTTKNHFSLKNMFLRQERRGSTITGEPDAQDHDNKQR